MAKTNNIYSGPGWVSLFDSVNGMLDLGLLKMVTLDSDPKSESFMSDEIGLYNLLSVNIDLIDTAADMAAALVLKQAAADATMHIITPSKVFIVNNLSFVVNTKRPMEPTEPHIKSIVVMGVENDLTSLENLLALNTAFNDYTQWTGVGGASVSAGPTNAIRFHFDDSGQTVTTKLRIAGKKAITFIVSGSEALNSWSTYFQVFPILYKDGSPVLTPTGQMVSATDTSFALTYNMAETEFDEIGLQVYSPLGTHQPIIENLQLELGEQTAFREV